MLVVFSHNYFSSTSSSSATTNEQLKSNLFLIELSKPEKQEIVLSNFSWQNTLWKIVNQQFGHNIFVLGKYFKNVSLPKVLD